MAINQLLVTIAVAFLFQGTMGVDYCSLIGCHDRHIACRNNGSFGIECPQDARMVDMVSHKDMILKMFNEIRNEIAGGKIEPFPVASRMAHMKWSPELEYLATLNVRTCRNLYDKCRSTKLFPFAGQNIAIYSYTGDEELYSDDEIIKERIEEWLEQFRYTDVDVINSFPAEAPIPMVGDFTIAINEKNSDLGCAAARFTKDFYNHFLFVCNFSVGNLIGKATYTVGDIPASDCKNRYGASYEYPNLCHVKEIYNYDIDLE